MKLFCTQINAISPKEGQLKSYCGPDVPGINEATAQEYCENNGLGYCKIVGELIAEIPCKKGTHEADLNRIIDYEKEKMN